MLTLPSTVDRRRTDRPAYRPFSAEVRAVVALSPSFIRVTFTGDELDTFGSAGLDQRIKIVLPLDGIDAPRGFAHLGFDDPAVLADGSWYERWRAQPDAVRNPFRTYTVRAVRHAERELDVDFAVHGSGAAPDGPASRWLRQAQPGDQVVIVGPDDLSSGWRIGLDWKPGDARDVLLVGDETAVPAICAILEQLDPEVSATAFVEVPGNADFLGLELRGGDHEVTWLSRGDHPRGEALEAAVRGWARAHASVIVPAPAGMDAAAHASTTLDDSAVAAGALLWDSPEPQHGRFYAWIAGETALVVGLRRFLVTELGVDRSRVAFMGYWRQGAAELS